MPAAGQTWQSLLLEVSKSNVIDAGNLRGAAVLVCEAVRCGLEVERCSLWLLDDGGHSLRCEYLVDQRETHAQPSLLLDDEAFPRYFAALRELRSLDAGDALHDPRTAEFVDSYLWPQGILAMLDTPIRRGAQLAGIICAEHRGSARRWNNEEMVFVGNLADLFARAMTAAERVRYEQELQQLNLSLERRVEERTRSLQETLAHLEATREQLVESEKLAALGSLVAGVAHEINTPIGVALTASSHCVEATKRLRDALAGGSLSRSQLQSGLAQSLEGLELVLRNLERAAKLIASFKQTAADRTSEQRARFELGDYVASVISTLQPMLKRRGVLAELVPHGYTTLDSYPGAIAHIVTNLVTNAVNHGFGEHYPEPRIHLLTALDGGQAVLEVRDNGRGMDADTLQHAMEPFFTTARGRGGTGLGLSIVNSMVSQTLGGQMLISSQPGTGTCVRIELPLSAPE